MARRKAPTPFLDAARGKGWRQRVALEGGAELQAALRSMDRAISGPVLLVAVAEGGKVLQGAMASLAPHDPTTALDLRDNIGQEVIRVSPRRAQTGVGPKKEVFYGTFQELGTSDMPAQPFMRPALDATRDDIVAAVGEKLREAIAAVVNGN